MSGLAIFLLFPPCLASAPYLDLFMQAEQAFNRGRYDEAEALLERVVQIKPDFAPARFLLGRALDEMGREDEAARHFEAFLSLLGRPAEKADMEAITQAAAWLLDHYLRRRKPKKATEIYRRFPSAVEGREWEAGEAFIEVGLKEEGLKLRIEGAFQASSTFSFVKRWQRVLEEASIYDKKDLPLQVAERRCKRIGAGAWDFLALALSLEEAKRRKEALEAARRAFSLVSDDPEVMAVFGNALCLADEVDDGIRTLWRASLLGSRLALDWLFDGLADAGRAGEIPEKARALVKRNPRLVATIYRNAIWALAHKGLWREAASLLLEAPRGALDASEYVIRSLDDADLLVRLSCRFFDEAPEVLGKLFSLLSKRFEELGGQSLLDALSKAAAERPDDPFARLWRAKALLCTGSREEATEEAKRAVAAMRGLPTGKRDKLPTRAFLNEVLNVFLRAGAAREGSKFLASLAAGTIMREFEAEACLAAARLAHKAGLYGLAARIASKATDISPAETRALLIEALPKLGMVRRALAEAEALVAMARTFKDLRRLEVRAVLRQVAWWNIWRFVGLAVMAEGMGGAIRRLGAWLSNPALEPAIVPEIATLWLASGRPTDGLLFFRNSPAVSEDGRAVGEAIILAFLGKWDEMTERLSHVDKTYLERASWLFRRIEAALPPEGAWALCLCLNALSAACPSPSPCRLKEDAAQKLLDFAEEMLGRFSYRPACIADYVEIAKRANMGGRAADFLLSKLSALPARGRKKLGLLLEDLGRWEEALEVWSKVPEDFEPPVAQAHRARALVHLGRTREAADTILLSVLYKSKWDPEGNVAALADFVRSFPEEVEALLQRLEKVKIPTVRLVVGLGLAMAGKDGEARKFMLEGLAEGARKGDSDLLALAGRALDLLERRCKDPGLTFDFSAKILESFPANHQVLPKAAESLLGAYREGGGDIGRAVRAIETAVKKGARSLCGALLRALVMAGRVPEAVEKAKELSLPCDEVLKVARAMLADREAPPRVLGEFLEAYAPVAAGLPCRARAWALSARAWKGARVEGRRRQAVERAFEALAQIEPLKWDFGEIVESFCSLFEALEPGDEGLAERACSKLLALSKPEIRDRGYKEVLNGLDMVLRSLVDSLDICGPVEEFASSIAEMYAAYAGSFAEGGERERAKWREVDLRFISRSRRREQLASFCEACERFLAEFPHGLFELDALRELAISLIVLGRLEEAQKVCERGLKDFLRLRAIFEALEVCIKTARGDEGGALEDYKMLIREAARGCIPGATLAVLDPPRVAARLGRKGLAAKMAEEALKALEGTGLEPLVKRDLSRILRGEVRKE